MRKIFLLVATILFALLAIGQPKGFNYQAAIRTSEGEPIASKQITVRISLQDELQNPYYSEQHSITTNEFGVFSITIGEGSPTSGSFESIPWQATSIYLQTEVDEENNGSFVSIGQATKLQTVPYALFAQNATQGDTGNGIESVSFNPTGTLTFVFTNGATYTTPSLIGPQGPAGTGLNLKGGWITGTSYTAGDYVFASSVTNPAINSMWICENSNGFISTIEPKDDQANWVEFSAPKGEDGIGITSTIDNGNGTLTFTYSDGSTFTTSDLTGPVTNGTLGQTLRHNGTTWVATSNIYNPGDKVEVVSDPNLIEETPIFSVKNKLGQTVFAVYQSGVRVYVEDAAIKGAKGGFAIGGITNQTKQEVEYFRITPDSARIYINQTPTGTKGAKGGFAIGGITNQTKGVVSQNLFFIAPDSARIYIKDEVGVKGAKGGFAIGGITNQTKSTTNNYLYVHRDSTRVYINDAPTKGAKGGFAIGGITNQTKGGTASFFDVATSATGTVTPSQKRVLWYPIKNAFLAGRVLIESPDSVGENSFATG